AGTSGCPFPQEGTPSRAVCVPINTSVQVGQQPSVHDRSLSGMIASRAGPVGAGNSVTLCGLGIFVDQAAEPVTAPNAHTGHLRKRRRPPGGRALLQCPVRPMAVVMIYVLAEDQPQM